MSISGSRGTAMALVAAGWLIAAAPVHAQIRIQDHVVSGADAAMRGFQESDFPRVHRLAENLYAVEDIAGPIDGNTAFTTNAMFIVTSEGVVVLDAFKDVASTTKLVNIVKGVTTQPIRYVVIGADHTDHIAGNQAFITAFPKVVFITHPNARISDVIRARVGLYVVDSYTLTLGGVNMEIKFLGRAHTASDLVVYLPQSKILWASETFFNGLYPSPGGSRSAYPIEWLEVIRKLDKIGATLILPNHGFIDSPKVLMTAWSEWNALFENLIAQGTALHMRGTPLDAAAYGINIGRFQYWYRAANNLQSMLARIYGELDGTLPAYVVTTRTPAVDMSGAALPGAQNIVGKGRTGPVPNPVSLDATGLFQAKFVSVGDDMFIGGQPTEKALRDLRAKGVTTIVNLRMPEEMARVGFDEAALAKELGIRYVHIPMRGTAENPYGPKELDAFTAAMASADGKVLLHCTIAWRASHLWAAYLIRERKTPVATALSQARLINLMDDMRVGGDQQPLEGFLGRVVPEMAHPKP